MPSSRRPTKTNSIVVFLDIFVTYNFIWSSFRLPDFCLYLMVSDFQFWWSSVCMHVFLMFFLVLIFVFILVFCLVFAYLFSKERKKAWSWMGGEVGKIREVREGRSRWEYILWEKSSYLKESQLVLNKELLSSQARLMSYVPHSLSEN